MNERKPVGQENAMEAAATRKKTTNKPAKLGRDVQARLGQQLRAMYDEVVGQGVPDRSQVHGPAQEADPPRLARSLSQDGQLAIQPGPVAGAAAEQPEPAGVTDRRG